MSIVDFPSRAKQEEPEELVIICECGCTTFLVLSSGLLECSGCGAQMEDDLTGVARKSVKPTVRSDTKTSTHFSSEEFALRSVTSKANLANTAAVIVMNKDGRTHYWSCASKSPSPEEIDWYEERVEQMREMFVDRHRR